MDENVYVQAVRRVKKGETRSFGEIAALAGKPRAPRAAGRALTSYPVDGPAPWQRAVTASGGLSIDPARASVQLERLRRDGARPRAGEKVAAWAKRVRTPFVGHYKDGLFVERTHPLVARFDPLFVERLGSETQAAERGFEHAEDREIRLRFEADDPPIPGEERRPRRSSERSRKPVPVARSRRGR